MGRLEKQIIVGALALVGVLIAVVILKGLKPRDSDLANVSPVREGSVSLDERPLLDVGLVPGGSASISLDEERGESGIRPFGGEAVIQPAVLRPEDEIQPVTPKTEPRLERDPGKPRDYVVQDGEILGLIAQRELGSVRHIQAILDLNPGVDPDRISDGDVLLLPSLSALEAERKVPAVRRDPALEGVRTHQVADGETLWDIAERYYGSGVHSERIVAANRDKLKSADTVLRIDWLLVIPE